MLARYRHPRPIPSLDGFRCIGLCVVVFAHLPKTGWWPYDALWQLNQGSRLAYLWLDSFFALSGFLITRLLLAERAASGRISFGRFYARRALRILPIYYLTLIACAVLFQFPLREIAALASYTFNVYHPLVPTPNAMEHTWSLSVEEQFYLVWPLLIALVPLRLGTLVTGRIVPALALASALAITIAVPLRENVLAGNLVYMLPLTRMMALSLGAWLAFREHEQRPMADAMMAAFAAGAVVILVLDKVGRDRGLIVSQGLYWSLALAAYGLMSVALIGALVSGTSWMARALQRGMGWRPIRIAGRATYGGYLYHLPVLYYLGLNDAAVNGAPQPLSRVLLAIAVTVGITFVSGRYIEAPLLTIKDRIRRTGVEDGRAPAHPLLGQRL